MIDEISIFHFTDFHWSSKAGGRITMRQQDHHDAVKSGILNAQVFKDQKSKINVLLLGGDYCHQGNFGDKHDFETYVLRPLIDAPRKHGWSWDAVIAVPGNHDVKLDGRIGQVSNEEKFKDFLTLFENLGIKVHTPFSESPVVSLCDKKIKIWLVNSSVACGMMRNDKEEQQNQMVAILKRYEDKLRTEKKYTPKHALVLEECRECITSDPLEAMRSDDTEKDKIIEEFENFLACNNTISPPYIEQCEFDRCDEFLEDSDLLRIAIVHHPSLPWYTDIPENRNQHWNAAYFNDALIDRNFQILFHGHLHDDTTSFYALPRDGHATPEHVSSFFETGFLSIGTKWFKTDRTWKDHGFSVVRLIPQKRDSWMITVNVSSYQRAKNNQKKFRKDSELELPVKLLNLPQKEEKATLLTEIRALLYRDTDIAKSKSDIITLLQTE